MDLSTKIPRLTDIRKDRVLVDLRSQTGMLDVKMFFILKIQIISAFYIKISQIEY